MTEKNFGLSKRPFRARPTGTDVFVGPQTATVMAGLKKALAAQDSVITIAGPAGSGKTTIVGKALDVMTGSHKAIHLGRIQLDGDDVLDFLLEELGVDQLPNGSIRRFGIFRRKLAEFEKAGKRLVVVIEDAVRAGADTLAEIEALTAADAGVGEGAAMILMGDDRLADLARDPQLERLRQRIRGKLPVAPLSAAELRGYMMHCFRLAGNDFEQVFEPDAAVCLHGLTDGIPRVANQVVEATLTAAAARDMARIPARFLAETAQNEFGLRATENPVPVVARVPEPEKPADEDIPDLIQDTLPDLAVLSDELDPPEITAEASPESGAESPPVQDSTSDTDPAPVPELAVAREPESVPEPESATVPDWDRDPTCAELMPDLEALERAMAVARDKDEEDDEEEAQPPTLTAAVPAKPRPVAAEPEDIPEITLDNAIRERIQNNLIDEPGQISPVREEQPAASSATNDDQDIRLPPRQDTKADAELERIATELAKAKTIEDVDDKLAETLFGEEISFIAAQVVAKAAELASANDATRVAVGESVNLAQGNGIELSLEPDAPARDERGPETSDAQRLNSANASRDHGRDARGEPPPAGSAEPQAPPPPEESPESIEDQITSMTQTLKALNVKPPISSRSGVRTDADDDDDEDEPKSGFFSRFRRG